MDEDLHATGERIRSRMAAGMSQRELAERARMTPDALSRALNGQRGFSSAELARIGDVIGADLHWLITGREDPHRIEIAARHGWDYAARRHTNPGREADDATLALVIGAYRAAYPDGPPPTPALAADPAVLRERLGEDFVRNFADRAEEHLGIDVVRLAGLSTDYSLRIGERGVVLLATSPRWYRSNWSLAHEIGHLALGHHDGHTHSTHHEQPAHRFAAELLLPEHLVRDRDWPTVSLADLALFVWRSGVSVEALRRRLGDLGIEADPAVRASPGTTALLRQERQALRDVSEANGHLDEIAAREQQASGRRFPIGVIGALRDRVAVGDADPGVLAWALEVPIDEIEFPEPDEAAAAERYEQMLRDRPSAADWEARIAAMSGPAAR